MIKCNYLLLFFCSYLAGCSGQSIPAVRGKDYVKNKSMFEEKFIRHFPNSIKTQRFLTVSNLSPETNKVSFCLYEFELATATLDSLTKMVESENIKSYNWSDSCLLILHPNETLDPFDEEYIDSSRVNMDCLDNKLPIPNFINLKSPNSEHGISMDSTFNIFILESKSGNHSQQYNMIPLKSMPRAWENGFSRGIVISKERKVVVYWMIIW